MRNEDAFAKQNSLYLDYHTPDGANLHAYVDKGYEVIQRVELGKYMWENGLDSVHILGLLALHIGFALSGERFSNRAREKLYNFAEKVKGKAPKMKELIDASLKQDTA